MDYEHLLASLLVDLVAISLLTYGLYFRRHRRRDLTLGFMGVNVGLFAVSSFTATSSISVGFGIGLFALLSVIRLRSTTASQEEIGYYFVALVLGLVNGLSTADQWRVAITLNVTLLAVMYVADHPRMLPHVERHQVVLSGKPRPLDSLRGELERRLGYEVTRLQVLEIDYSNRRTRVDVRIDTSRPVVRPAAHEPEQDGPRADTETRRAEPETRRAEPETRRAEPETRRAEPEANGAPAAREPHLGEPETAGQRSVPTEGTAP